MKDLLSVWSCMLLLMLAAAWTGCAVEQRPEGEAAAPPPPEVTEATARIGPKSGSQVTGVATFTAEDGGVTLFLSLQNLPPGLHAAHIHEKGDCSAEDGTSAGGHWNPTGDEHGKWGEPPFHLGDLGNLEVDEGGNASMTVTTEMWSLGTGDAGDVVGKAIIVHEKADDFTSQPTGAAGGRIACGVIGAGSS